jgi:hypothetical protein
VCARENENKKETNEMKTPLKTKGKEKQLFLDGFKYSLRVDAECVCSSSLKAEISLKGRK